MIRFKAHYEYQVSCDEMWLWVARHDEDTGKRSLLAPAAMQDRNTDARLVPKPFLRGDSRQFLQAILDEAWSRGLRPTGVESNAGQLSAMKDHLADMRAIVGDKLKVALPGRNQ